MQDGQSEPGDAHEPIEPGRGGCDGPNLGVVDAHEAVDLHGPMPEAPDHGDADQGVQVQGKNRSRRPG